MGDVVNSYREIIYKYQTDIRGLKKPTELLMRFDKMAKWYKYRLKGLLPKDTSANILDIPCGYGNFLYFLKKEGYKNILGVDFDSNQVELANSIGLNAVVGEAALFLSDKHDLYNLVSSIDFVEHLTKAQIPEYLSSCFNALKGGGSLILRTPCCDGIFGARDRYNDLTHETGFTSGLIRSLLRVIGFKDILVLDERPQPYRFVNVLRLSLYVCFTNLTNVFFWSIGLTPPKVWTTSMWVIAKKG
jgi:SAM-dependent methyltransferase